MSYAIRKRTTTQYLIDISTRQFYIISDKYMLYKLMVHE